MKTYKIYNFICIQFLKEAKSKTYRILPVSGLHLDFRNHYAFSAYVNCDQNISNFVTVHSVNYSKMISPLHSNFHPRNWQGTYDELLPQIELAFIKCVENFNQNVDEELRKELIIMIKQLCHPDIKKRGIVRSQGLNSVQFSLQQYISRLDLLARKWEYSFRKVKL